MKTNPALKVLIQSAKFGRIRTVKNPFSFSVSYHLRFPVSKLFFFVFRTASSVENIIVTPCREPLGHMGQLIVLASLSSPRLRTFTMQVTMPSLLPSVALLSQLR